MISNYLPLVAVATVFALCKQNCTRRKHATIQHLPTNSENSWEQRRGEGLSPGNKNVYGVPTALLTNTIITSRFTEARSQLLAAQPERGLDNQSEFRTSTG